MNERAYFGVMSRQRVAAMACGLALVLGAWTVSGHAAQSSGSFSVTVNLSGGGNLPPGATPAATGSESCTLYSVFATSVKVSCFPGAVSYFAVPSWIDVSRIAVGEPLEGPVAGRTATSWRWVTLENLKYLEMMVRW